MTPDDETDLTDELESADCLEDQLDALWDDRELDGDCPNCNGHGYVMGSICELCDGEGYEL